MTTTDALYIKELEEKIEKVKTAIEWSIGNHASGAEMGKIKQFKEEYFYHTGAINALNKIKEML